MIEDTESNLKDGEAIDESSPMKPDRTHGSGVGDMTQAHENDDKGLIKKNLGDEFNYGAMDNPEDASADLEG